MSNKIRIAKITLIRRDEGPTELDLHMEENVRLIHFPSQYETEVDARKDLEELRDKITDFFNQML